MLPAGPDQGRQRTGHLSSGRGGRGPIIAVPKVPAMLSHTHLDTDTYSHTLIHTRLLNVMSLELSEAFRAAAQCFINLPNYLWGLNLRPRHTERDPVTHTHTQPIPHRQTP